MTIKNTLRKLEEQTGMQAKGHQRQNKPSISKSAMTQKPMKSSTPTGDEFPQQNTMLRRVDTSTPDGSICPECGTPAGVGLYRQDVPVGHPDFGKLIKCTNEYHSAVREDRMAQISQMGPVDIKRRLGDIKPNPGNTAMLEAARDAIHSCEGWYYFYGGPGNAKSEVLKAIVNECNQNDNGPAVYTSMGRIITYIKDAFSPKSTEGSMERFDKLIATRVLAIDEMDKIKETDWLNEFRFQFLDARYNSAVNGLTMTVFAGNPNPADIYDNVLYDRFRDGRWQIVENTAASARPYMRKKSDG